MSASPSMDVEALARLAGIALKADENLILSRDLPAMLKRLDVLPEAIRSPKQLDPLLGREAFASIPREDVSHPSGPGLQRALLEAAPVLDGQYFSLPNILER